MMMMMMRATGRRYLCTTEIPFSCLDIRVGKIVRAELVDESDKLFKSRIDVGTCCASFSSSARKNLSISGEDEPRQIISGLRQYYKLDDLENRSCLVVCNLPVRFVILFSDIITFYTTTNRKQRFAVSNRLEWCYAE